MSCLMVTWSSKPYRSPDFMTYCTIEYLVDVNNTHLDVVLSPGKSMMRGL